MVSQATCSWGKDLYGRPRLAELARALDRVEELDWVRLLYLYPSAIGDPLIDALAEGGRLERAVKCQEVGRMIPRHNH